MSRLGAHSRNVLPPPHTGEEKVREHDDLERETERMTVCLRPVFIWGQSNVILLI